MEKQDIVFLLIMQLIISPSIWHCYLNIDSIVSLLKSKLRESLTMSMDLEYLFVLRLNLAR